MRDPARIRPLLAALEAAWARNPDLRLGQIIVNALARNPSDLDVRLFYIEDAALVSLIADSLKDDP